jgi:hypothetical protein
MSNAATHRSRRWRYLSSAARAAAQSDEVAASTTRDGGGPSTAIDGTARLGAPTIRDRHRSARAASGPARDSSSA